MADDIEETALSIIDPEEAELAQQEIQEENPLFELDEAKIADILLRQDYSRLSPGEQIAFIKYRCDKLGLDITSNPFVFIAAPTRNDPGRKLLINTKNLYAFLTFKYSLEVTIKRVDFVTMLGKSFIQAEATALIPSTGAKCDDIGIVFVDKNMAPVELANLRMKAVTKAKCRATHNVVGIGGLSYIEAKDLGMTKALAAASVPGKRLVRKVKK